MKKWLLLLSTICISSTVYAQITIDSLSTEPVQFSQDITGLNFGLLYPIIAIERDSAGAIVKDSISTPFVSALIDNKIQKLRFPAGTFSQFYHFNGKSGYGYDSTELICRPGTLDDSLILGRMAVDSIISKNHAYYMVELNKRLVSETGKPLEIVYVANLLSHFNLNHFNKYNAGIETYIRSGILSLVPFADINFDVMDTLLAYQLARRINKLIELPSGNDFIELLKSDSNIVKQINENLNCIRFLKDNGIVIKKVELGNEMYNQLEVYDDDCDKIGFDCTLHDTSAFVYNRGKLTIYSFCEGLFKYFILSKLYATLLDTLDSQISIGLSGSIGNSSMLLNADSSIFMNKIFNATAKQDLLWNNMIANATYSDAIVLHTYLQQMPICEVLQQEGIVPEAFIYVIRKFIDYYTDTLLFDLLNNAENIVPNKDFWITEWNIGAANIIANSFAHNTFIHKFWKAIYNYKLQHEKLTDFTYHNIIATMNPQYSLFNAYNDSITYEYNFQKNDLYYGYMSSYRLYNAYPKVSISHPYSKDVYIDMFYNPENGKYYLLYMNNSGSDITIDTRSIQKVTSSVHPAITHYENLHANYWCAANRAFCDTSLCETEDSIMYFHESDTLLRGAYTLSGYSLGTLTLDFEAPSSIRNNLSPNFILFPNPAKEFFTISLKKQDDYFYEILDAKGRLIEKGNFFGNSKIVYSSNWVRGIYWVRIYTPFEQFSALPISIY